MTIKKIRFIDLFAGMGGIRIGLEKALDEVGITHECVFTSEIKEHAVNALKTNFPTDCINGDITKVNEKDIPSFDILLGGFPCQAFSAAGKGHGFADTRGTLFFDVARILKKKQPKGFILENVEGLVKHDLKDKKDKVGNTLRTILDTLDELGYIVSWKVLDSMNFGLPQSRKRIYIVGTKKNAVDLEEFNIISKKFKDIKESNLPTVDSHFTRCLLNSYDTDFLYGKAIKDKRGGKNNIHSWDIGLKGNISNNQKALLNRLFKERRKKHWAIEIGIKWMDGMPLTVDQISTFFYDEDLQRILDDLVEKGYLKLEHPKKEVEIKVGDIIKKERQYDISKPKGYNIVSGKLSFEFTKIIDPNDIAPTLVATDVSRLGVVDGKGVRQLSLREGLRLFGYPDSYQLPNGTNKNMRESFDLLGNTVAINVIQSISTRLLEALEV